jgi:hypothetical protein
MTATESPGRGLPGRREREPGAFAAARGARPRGVAALSPSRRRRRSGPCPRRALRRHRAAARRPRSSAAPPRHRARSVPRPFGPRLGRRLRVHRQSPRARSSPPPTARTTRPPVRRLRRPPTVIAKSVSLMPPVRGRGAQCQRRLREPAGGDRPARGRRRADPLDADDGAAGAACDDRRRRPVRAVDAGRDRGLGPVSSADGPPSPVLSAARSRRAELCAPRAAVRYPAVRPRPGSARPCATATAAARCHVNAQGYVEIGVASYSSGSTCGTDQDYFARVSTLQPWIASQVEGCSLAPCVPPARSPTSVAVRLVRDSAASTSPRPPQSQPCSGLHDRAPYRGRTDGGEPVGRLRDAERLVHRPRPR